MRNKNYSKVLIPLIISVALGIGIYLGNNIGSKSLHNPVYEKVSTILSLIETDYVDTVNMEEIIEIVLDLILEGSMQLSQNKKLPKWIRYSLIGFLILFFSIVIISLFIIGLVILKESILGYLIIIISLLLLIGGIIKVKKVYSKKVGKE